MSRQRARCTYYGLKLGREDNELAACKTLAHRLRDCSRSRGLQTCPARALGRSGSGQRRFDSTSILASPVRKLVISVLITCDTVPAETHNFQQRYQRTAVERTRSELRPRRLASELDRLSLHCLPAARADALAPAAGKKVGRWTTPVAAVPWLTRSDGLWAPWPKTALPRTTRGRRAEQ